MKCPSLKRVNLDYNQSESLQIAEIFDSSSISTQYYSFYGGKKWMFTSYKSISFPKWNNLDVFITWVLLRQGPDGIWIREQSKQEIGCQENKGSSREKFREVAQCFYPKASHWGFITTESFEIWLSPDSTKHTVSKGNLCSNSLLTGKSFWVHSTLSSSFTKEKL